MKKIFCLIFLLYFFSMVNAAETQLKLELTADSEQFLKEGVNSGYPIIKMQPETCLIGNIIKPKKQKGRT